MVKKTKTLGDYITSGRHEFVAFVKDEASLFDGGRSNHGTHGNNLGKIYFGVLVCGKRSEKDEEYTVRFFCKDSPIYKDDSDISFRDFGYNASVDNENPLAISTTFTRGWHLKTKSKEFDEAKELLQKYGLY